MIKVINGKDAILGRIASYAAKEALKGEEIAIVNCEKLVITGSAADIKQNFEIKRGRVGSTQKGPKVSRTSEKIVRRVIRGMLPNYRVGRGRDAFKRVKCYVGVPKEFENSKMIEIETKTGFKSKKIKVEDMLK